MSDTVALRKRQFGLLNAGLFNYIQFPGRTAVDDQIPPQPLSAEEQRAYNVPNITFTGEAADLYYEPDTFFTEQNGFFFRRRLRDNEGKVVRVDHIRIGELDLEQLAATDVMTNKYVFRSELQENMRVLLETAGGEIQNLTKKVAEDAANGLTALKELGTISDAKYSTAIDTLKDKLENRYWNSATTEFQITSRTVPLGDRLGRVELLTNGGTDNGGVNLATITGFVKKIDLDKQLEDNHYTKSESNTRFLTFSEFRAELENYDITAGTRLANDIRLYVKLSEFEEKVNNVINTRRFVTESVYDTDIKVITDSRQVLTRDLSAVRQRQERFELEIEDNTKRIDSTIDLLVEDFQKQTTTENAFFTEILNNLEGSFESALSRLTETQGEILELTETVSSQLGLGADPDTRIFALKANLDPIVTRLDQQVERVNDQGFDLIGLRTDVNQIVTDRTTFQDDILMNYIRRDNQADLQAIADLVSVEVSGYTDAQLDNTFQKIQTAVYPAGLNECRAVTLQYACSLTRSENTSFLTEDILFNGGFRVGGDVYFPNQGAQMKDLAQADVIAVMSGQVSTNSSRLMCIFNRNQIYVMTPSMFEDDNQTMRSDPTIDVINTTTSADGTTDSVRFFNVTNIPFAGSGDNRRKIFRITPKRLSTGSFVVDDTRYSFDVRVYRNRQAGGFNVLNTN